MSLFFFNYFISSETEVVLTRKGLLNVKKNHKNPILNRKHDINLDSYLKHVVVA